MVLNGQVVEKTQRHAHVSLMRPFVAYLAACALTHQESGGLY